MPKKNEKLLMIDLKKHNYVLNLEENKKITSATE